MSSLVRKGKWMNFHSFDAHSTLVSISFQVENPRFHKFHISSYQWLALRFLFMLSLLQIGSSLCATLPADLVGTHPWKSEIQANFVKDSHFCVDQSPHIYDIWFKGHACRTFKIIQGQAALQQPAVPAIGDAQWDCMTSKKIWKVMRATCWRIKKHNEKENLSYPFILDRLWVYISALWHALIGKYRPMLLGLQS